MTIADIGPICKTQLQNALSRVRQIPRDVLIISILVVSCTISFGLGYLAGQGGADSGQALRSDSRQGSQASLTAAPAPASTRVVASKTGTKYYLPTCAGVDRISDDKKVWFASPELAREEGYEPADNCKGLSL